MADNLAYWEAEYLRGDRLPADDPWFLPLLPPPPLRVLDAGCGDGGTAALLSGAGYEVVAFDLSPAALSRARRRHTGALFLVADVTEPGPSVESLAPFGAVLADLSLHYFRWEATARGLSLLAGLLERGAPLLLRVNSTLDTGFGYGRGTEIEPGLFEDPDSGTLKRFFDEQGLDRLLREAGCRPEFIRPAVTHRYGGRPKHVLECCCRPQ